MGFIVADEKSVWQPTQVIEWLGLTWDVKAGTLAISDKRISKAKKLLRTAAECPTMSAGELAAFVASIISMGAVWAVSLIL